MVSIGPTSSMRMERFEKEFIRKIGVKLVVGKGGMGAESMMNCARQAGRFGSGSYSGKRVNLLASFGTWYCATFICMASSV